MQLPFCPYWENVSSLYILLLTFCKIEKNRASKAHVVDVKRKRRKATTGENLVVVAVAVPEVDVLIIICTKFVAVEDLMSD